MLSINISRNIHGLFETRHFWSTRVYPQEYTWVNSDTGETPKMALQAEQNSDKGKKLTLDMQNTSDQSFLASET